MRFYHKKTPTAKKKHTQVLFYAIVKELIRVENVFMSVKVFIAGYGYLGQELGRILLHHQHTVIGLKRNLKPEDNIDSKVKILEKDFMELQAQELQSADIIVYCLSPKSSSEEDYKTSFLDGAKHLIKLYSELQHNPPVIFVSSSAVYATNDGSWVDETLEPQASHPRYRYLIEAEKLLQRSNLPVTIVRPSGLYGRNRHPLLDALLQSKTRVCHKTRYSNRIHITDCARALFHIMHLKKNLGLYILTDSEPTPINHIIAWLSATTGKPIPEERTDTSVDDGDFRTHKRLSNARLLETGFRFEFTSYKQGFKAILYDLGMLDIRY